MSASVEVITIQSDDEDGEGSSDLKTVSIPEKRMDENHNSSISSPKIEEVFQVEEYFLPSQVHSSNDQSHKQNPKEFLHPIVGNVNPCQNTEEHTGINISVEVITADSDDKQMRLKRLAKDLLKVVSVANIENTISEVSRSDFDISNLVPVSFTNGSSFSQKTCIPQKTYSADSTLKTLDKSLTPNESCILGPNEQSTQVKKKRRRPLGWQKNKALASKLRIKEQSSPAHIKTMCKRPFVCRKSETKIIIHNAGSMQSNSVSLSKNNVMFTNLTTSNREESCNPKYSADRQKDITSSVIQSVFDETTEISEDNYNISVRKGQDNYLVDDGQHDSTALEINESYRREGLHVDQGKKYCEARFPQNSESTNNVIYQVLHEKANSILSKEPTRPPKLNGYGNKCQSKLQQSIDTESEINQAEFVTCYNRIFDDYVTNLCSDMSDIILLAMKVEQTYKQRLLAAEEITCDQLREKEKDILKTSYLSANDKYKISFTTMFQDIVADILSNVSTTKLQQTFVFAWFLKLFLKIIDLSPELSDSLIVIWSKTTDLLSNYENPIPIIRDILSLSEVEFELECYKTLNLTLKTTSNSEIEAEEKVTSEPREKTSDSLSSHTIQSSLHRVNGHKYKIKTSNNNYHCHQTNGTKINLFINQSTPRRQLITIYTPTENVYKRNSGECHQSSQSAPKTTTRYNVKTCDSDISDQLRKQVDSGSLTISCLKESTEKKKESTDLKEKESTDYQKRELLVVPEVTPKVTSLQAEPF